MQLFPEKVRKLWNGWEIRVMVLFSLLLQIILIIFGSRRKYTARCWIRILVWSAYLTADWVATVALGNLASIQGDSKENCPNSQDQNNMLQAFWAPFLLLHLGGPDSITAYSLEDNELWLRHLLGLVIQVGVAFYVFLRSWSNTFLTFLAIPMFISGIIKYGERTWVLYSSSNDRFKDSLLLTNDPSLDLIKIIKRDPRRELRDHGENLVGAYFLFRKFTYLYAGLLLNNIEAMESSITFDNISAQDVFNMIADELGFMYDVLYTKATIAYSRLGISLRCVSFLSYVFALVVFSIMVDIHEYSLIDISITFSLLISAIVLEVYALVIHIFSNWTKLCLTKFKRENPRIYNATYGALDSLCFRNKSWSKSMGQFNLINHSLIKDVPFTCIGLEKLFSINYKLLEMFRYLTWEDVNVDLLDMILDEFNQKLQTYARFSLLNDFEVRKNILAQRGDYVLEERYKLYDFRWCTTDVEFDHSVLIWHIATDLCYYDDFNKLEGANSHPQCKISKHLSDYMLYLLVLRPSMMPKGIAELRYAETNDEVMKFLQPKHNVISNKTGEACKVLLETVESTTSTNTGVEDNDLSVLSFGCKLAKQLQLCESQDGWDYEMKWKMMSEVWVEMLGYAANHCEWKEHGQQLRKGGELLTHVCLFMTHFGFSEQYRNYARDVS